MEQEQKLIPILREAIETIKMVFYMKLRAYLQTKYRDREASFCGLLAGAIINDLFGTPNPQEPFASFAQEHQSLIKEELDKLATQFEEMRIPLTDALRIQFLCDYQEGIDSSAVLQKAKDYKVLLLDREAPLPASFLNLARRLGGAFDLLYRS